MVSTPESKPRLAIVGPTASGKSELAVELADRVGGEIISCDSIQLYRGFDVASAKPSSEVRARVRHHLIDVAEWDESFDAQRYVELADRALLDIDARGRIPIICGGTGLYMRAFRYGLVALPEPPPGLSRSSRCSASRRPGGG
ncbi:MAG: isopentenyl transferase family protein, partial [Myxococcota bacterium]